jgi:hypothetical protein
MPSFLVWLLLNVNSLCVTQLNVILLNNVLMKGILLSVVIAECHSSK